MDKNTQNILISGVAASGILYGVYYFFFRCTNDWFADPDITRDGDVFTSSGGVGHRIWIPNKFSGEGNTYNGKTALNACDISKETISIDIENLSSTIDVGIEMNCSYGFTYKLTPGKRVQLTSTPTGILNCPGAVINQTDQPNQPFARSDNASCNVWFYNGKVKIHSVTIT